MIQGEALSETTIRLIGQMSKRGSKASYIANSLGIHKSTVYRFLAMNETEYEIERKQRKKRQPLQKRQRPMKRKNFRDHLPPEQWDSAQKFLHLVWHLKRMAQTSVSIDLAELKKAYQALPN